MKTHLIAQDDTDSPLETWWTNCGSYIPRRYVTVSKATLLAAGENACKRCLAKKEIRHDR